MWSDTTVLKQMSIFQAQYPDPQTSIYGKNTKTTICNTDSYTEILVGLFLNIGANYLAVHL